MKPKQLMILGAIVLVLIGMVLIKEWLAKPADLQDEVALEALVPAGLTGADIVRVEMYAGAKPDQKVVLARSEDGTAWSVASHFNAPVTKDKIDGFLNKLEELEGEERPSDQTDEALTEYDLTDPKAFHVLAFKKGEDKPAIHLLVGKEAKYDAVFMRPVDSKAVYTANMNPRREAGLYSSDETAELKADAWLDKKVVDIPADKLTRVALAMPDKALVVEKREKPKPEPAADQSADAATTPADDKKPEYEWVVAEGDPGRPLKESGIQDYLRAYSSLYAADIVDPSKLAEYGLESPAFKATVKVADQEGETVLEGGRPAGSEDGYVRVAGAKSGVIYKVNKTSFERIFPKGSQFFELSDLTVDSQTIDRIEITQPDGRFVLAKRDGTWGVETPQTTFKPVQSVITTMATTLAGWKPADYAQTMEGRGLDTPSRSVTFTAGPGNAHTVTLGGESQSIEGFYARLDGGDKALVMDKSTVDKIFVAPNTLFERGLLSITAGDINEITVAKGSESFVVARQGETGVNQWSLSSGGAPVPNPNMTDIEDMASALATLQAAEVQIGQPSSVPDTYATITFKTKDGQERVLTIGTEQGGKHPASLTGVSDGFVISPADAQRLTPSLDSLKQASAAATESSSAPDATPTDAAPESSQTPEPASTTPVAPEVAPLPEIAPVPAPAAPAAPPTQEILPAPAPESIPPPPAPVPEAEPQPAPDGEAPAPAPAAAPAGEPSQEPVATAPPTEEAPTAHAEVAEPEHPADEATQVENAPQPEEESAPGES